MRLIYHLGVHCTDEERLLRCLLKNRGPLAGEGIIVPGPARYRTLMRDTAMQLKGQPASEETQTMILDQILGGSTADRLVLSWENFLGYAQGAVRSTLYASGAERMLAFRQVFPGLPHEFHLALRNPATFLPAVYQKQQGRSMEEYLDGVDIAALRWSDLILQLRAMVPDVPITVWCDEDTPLLWPEVLQSVSGHAPGLVLEDAHDLVTSLLSADGRTRMATYIQNHPPQNAGQRRRIVSAFLDKFALPDQIDMAVEMPGWTQDTVEGLSRAYDADISRIMAIEGVKVLAP
jgi:hypothetical protein